MPTKNKKMEVEKRMQDLGKKKRVRASFQGWRLLCIEKGEGNSEMKKYLHTDG